MPEVCAESREQCQAHTHARHLQKALFQHDCACTAGVCASGSIFVEKSSTDVSGVCGTEDAATTNDADCVVAQVGMGAPACSAPKLSSQHSPNTRSSRLAQHNQHGTCIHCADTTNDNCAAYYTTIVLLIALQCGDGNTLISGSCYALSGTLRLDAPVRKDSGGAQVQCSTTAAAPYGWACSSTGGTAGELKATASCCGSPLPRK